MIFKKNKIEKFGIPYMGSKTKIANEIVMCFPRANNFYDLFGGGFSITHYTILKRKNSFKDFHFNEIRPGMCDLIQDAIAGKYSYKNFKPDWVSREDFENQKDSSAYVKVIWSFGNNGKSYMFGKEIEEIKRQMHMAVVFDKFENLFIDTFNFKEWPKKLSITGKRLFLREVIRRLQKEERYLLELQQLQQLQRLERLGQLEQLEQDIKFTSLDYKEVKIKKNSVIYCDIPYKGTADYGSTFNHDDFFDWAHNQKEAVFISEYNIEDKRFHLIKKIDHRTSYSKDKNSKVTEKLYCNDAGLRMIKEQLGIMKVTKLKKK